jgi:hypothetical protein
MSNSKHLAVRNAIAALLAAAPAIAAKITPGRRYPMADQDSEQVFVYLDTSVPTRADIGGMPDDWSTRVRVEIAARGQAGTPAEDRGDALLTAAHGRVMADPSLGDLCLDCYPVGIAWGGDEADTTLAVVQIVFEAKHRVSATSIAA